jgi:hypothetical protein
VSATPSYIPAMRLPALLLTVVTLAACASAGGAPPASFIRSNAEGRTTRTIDVREGLGRAASMRVLTEVLGTRYSVEVTDPRAGFAMTAWEASCACGTRPTGRVGTSGTWGTTPASWTP